MEGVDPFEEWDKQEEKDKFKILTVIETDGILKNYDKKDIKTFVYDLFLVFDILDKLNDNYSDNNTQLDRDLKRYKRLIDDWIVKYRDIIFELKFETTEISLKVFFKEKTLDNIMAVVKKMNRFDRIVEENEHQVTAVFELDGEENTLTLKQAEDRIRLIYLQEDMVNPKSPEFRICTFYGLKEGFNEDIDLQNYATEFSFDIDEDFKGEGWFKRYPGIKFRTR